ncbi:MBL fold metallo-hydrolase [Granulicatella sp. zg-ZJ]|uniref:MBL fold metallo-hydrolase n=1 Tax=Granulicatella sp. zg-ZJ TaxID=2678504 RepID=UPI0013D509AF|nr:MBL fold metallo-hydrolase [Granulicatella sp. zg-ZJ]NEW61779.1 MBL fold metallo-hydrolase [Granulicatella sp. zg-ZJ]
MKLTILGCMGAYPTPTQATSSYLLEADGFKLLVDIGSGAFQHLASIMEPTDIDALLITHYHADHIADLGVLQYAYQLKPALERLPKKILKIYGHQHSEEFSKLTMQNVSEGIVYNPEEILRVGPFKITFLKTIHPVVCYGIRVEDKNTKKVFVFTADSGYLADFITFAKDADLLLADAMFMNGSENSTVHMTAGEVGKIADLANVKQLVLTHLPVNYQSVLKQQAEEMVEHIPVYLAKDFDTYEI